MVSPHRIIVFSLVSNISPSMIPSKKLFSWYAKLQATLECPMTVCGAIVVSDGWYSSTKYLCINLNWFYVYNFAYNIDGNLHQSENLSMPTYVYYNCDQ